MPTPSEWTGLITGRTDPSGGLYVAACLQPGPATASSPFLALGSDGDEWWVKAPQPNLHKALVTEVVVGRVGAAIGAPVCDVAVIDIPVTLLPWEFKPGQQLPTGLGSATRNVPGALEEIRDSLDHRTDDDNRRWHAGVYALVDWCAGDDLQWLLNASEDWRLYSHDHGWYFPPGGPDWSPAALGATVDDDHALSDDATGLDPDELQRLADDLRNITRGMLRDLLLQIPASWPVTDSDLESLGWYLEQRAPQVADRMEALIGG